MKEVSNLKENLLIRFITLLPIRHIPYLDIYQGQLASIVMESDAISGIMIQV